MRIVLEGDPIAQIRMRLSSRGGKTRVYDPRTQDKNLLKKIINKQHDGDPYIEHPRVSFIFHMPIPASTPKKLLPLYRSGLLKHEKKPDVDNLVKLYLDCMDPIVFDGDQRVTLGPCIKLYHPKPKTIIYVDPMIEALSIDEVGPQIWYDLFGLERGRCSSFGMDYPHDCDSPPPLVPLQSPDTPTPYRRNGRCASVPLALTPEEQARQAYRPPRYLP